MRVYLSDLKKDYFHNSYKGPRNKKKQILDRKKDKRLENTLKKISSKGRELCATSFVIGKC